MTLGGKRGSERAQGAWSPESRRPGAQWWLQSQFRVVCITVQVLVLGPEDAVSPGEHERCEETVRCTVGNTADEPLRELAVRAGHASSLSPSAVLRQVLRARGARGGWLCPWEGAGGPC